MQYFSTKLFAKDPQVMSRFYSRILGLPITRRYEKAALLGQQLLITESGENGLYFESGNYHKIKNCLEEAGYPLSIRTTSAGQHIMSLYDPMGNHVEIGESMETVIQHLLEE